MASDYAPVDVRIGNLVRGNLKTGGERRAEAVVAAFAEHRVAHAAVLELRDHPVLECHVARPGRRRGVDGGFACPVELAFRGRFAL